MPTNCRGYDETLIEVLVTTLWCFRDCKLINLILIYRQEGPSKWNQEANQVQVRVYPWGEFTNFII